MTGDVSHHSQADQNGCGSAPALDNIFTPLIFGAPLSQLPVTSFPTNSYFHLL